MVNLSSPSPQIQELSPASTPPQNKPRVVWWFVRLLIGLMGLIGGGLLYLNEDWRTFGGASIIILIGLSMLFLFYTVLRRFLSSCRFILLDLVVFIVCVLGAAVSVFRPISTLFDSWFVFGIAALLALVYDLVRPHFRRSALALLVVLVIIFLISIPFGSTKRISRSVYSLVQAEQQEKVTQGTASQPLADLAMISVTGVHTLLWNEEQKTYEVTTDEIETKKTEDQFYEYRRLFADVDSLYIVYDDTIEKRPRKGGEVIQWKRPIVGTGLDLTYSHRIGAVEFHNGLMYVSANGKLYVLNNSLRTLGEVELEIGDGKSSFTKNAHDILFVDDYALLLDNVVQPIYIFTVDIQSSEQPRVVNRRGGSTINGHLKAQWLDDFNNWNIVLTDQTGYGGTASEERVLELSKAEYTTRLNPEQFTPWGKEHPLPRGAVIGGHGTFALASDEREEYGYSILKDLNRADDYFLVHDRKTRNVLVTKIDSSSQLLNPISLDRFEEVRASSFLSVSDVLYITIQNKLYVVNVGGSEPILVHSQTLSTNIQDIQTLNED